MTTSDQIAELKEHVNAATQEFDQAVAFHETWKPMVYNSELQQRMGTSFATQTFLVIRAALRREMLMALMRLWDTKKQKLAVRMTALAERLGDAAVIDALIADRIATQQIPGIEDHLRGAITTFVADVRRLIHKWTEGGTHAAVLRHLRTLRDEVLAHRQIVPSGPGAVTPDDSDVEDFYRDNLDLIRLLAHIVNGIACDPELTGGVYRKYAEFFWAGVRGERTEGHPDYRRMGPLNVVVEQRLLGREDA